MSTLSRSAIVGVLASIADLAALAALTRLDVSPAWANVPALALGVVIQFVGNKFWAFRAPTASSSSSSAPASNAQTLARQGSAFLAIEAVAFVLNAALFHLLAVVCVVPPLIARVIASAAVYFGFSYPLWGRVFAPPQRSPS